ncbi:MULTISPECIES: caspase family protein [unclassified Duganella]|uniref:caspase family protein n=1 Tax=unclassified Duganella TaxID=2636909 RepID=UPI000E34F813|nr:MULTISPECIES: caspase family protein [unclassified Duganella]RFP11305.1 caspase family protein [Duganella sp. BJB475]RFP29624.1 caspase family protein [Duganella sp. BJB476]
MIERTYKSLLILLLLLLTGCAASQMHGFENTYYSYNVPQLLLDKIALKLRQEGLVDARVGRDSVGRVQLAGSYQTEDEVDRAFVIVQSIVGLKSTSPFYPDNIRRKRWELEAGEQLARIAQAQRSAPRPEHRVALIIGINTFRDSRHWLPIQGEDDAAVVQRAAAQAGYTVTSLLGRQATKASIEAALRNIEADLRPTDSLFIYVSSHGEQPLPSANGNDERKMSIIAWDSGDAAINNRTDYELNLYRTAVPDTLLQKLAKKPTRNTRILIDTCYSGEMLKGLPDESGGYIAQANGGAAERAGISMAAWTGKAYTSKAIRFSDDAPARTQAAKRTQPQASAAASDAIDGERAYTIITATSEGEQSLGPPIQVGEFLLPDQRRTLRGSYFTQAFFAYLDVYAGQVEPAFAAARDFTNRKAQEVTGGARTQVPRQFSTRSAERNRL